MISSMRRTTNALLDSYFTSHFLLPQSLRISSLASTQNIEGALFFLVFRFLWAVVLSFHWHFPFSPLLDEPSFSSLLVPEPERVRSRSFFRAIGPGRSSFWGLSSHSFPHFQMKLVFVLLVFSLCATSIKAREAAGGDVSSLNFAAFAPFTYDHKVGGGSSLPLYFCLWTSILLINSLFRSLERRNRRIVLRYR